MVILSVTNGYSLANTVMWSIVFLKRCNNRAKAVFNRYSLAITGIWRCSFLKLSDNGVEAVINRYGLAITKLWSFFVDFSNLIIHNKKLCSTILCLTFIGFIRSNRALFSEPEMIHS